MKTRSWVVLLGAVTALGGLLALTPVAPTASPASAGAPTPPTIAFEGRYSTGLPDTSAEIVAQEGDLMYVLNATSTEVDVVDMSDPTDPQLLERLDFSAYGDGATSVTVDDGVAAVSVVADPKTDPGTVVFFDADGNVFGDVPAGALPDMVTFTPDGSRVLAANEGEPNSYGQVDSVDPEGSVSIFAAGPYRQVCDSEDGFTDVPETHPFAEEIDWLVTRCVTNGFEDGTFRSALPVSRQAAAAFLYRMAGQPEGEQPVCEDAQFPDVSSDHPFCGEIAWMVAQGITTGYGDGTFKPSNPVTRQAMAAFLYRIEGFPNGEEPVCEEAQFADVDTAHPFCGEIAWMVELGITEGYDDDTFRGGVAVSRQAAAAFFQRFAEPRVVGFTDFNVGGPRAAEVDEDIRIFGPGATVAQDLEPEYIGVSDDSSTAWVSLQENNALARIDVAGAAVEELQALGFKDHSLEDNGFGSSNALDGSDQDLDGDDGTIAIENWPVLGMYLPDTIATFAVGESTYVVTANEGDAREYDGFEEEERIKDLTLDETAFPDAEDIQDDEGIGRLAVTTSMGDEGDDGDFEELYSFGGRSFSIWTEDGELVYDSGDDFEQITATELPAYFNSDNDEVTFDTRSDAKGPEPEAVTTGVVDGRTYAFIGLERIGGVMVYDVSDPMAPTFVEYLITRDFTQEAAPDSAPEGMAFVAADESPTGEALLLVSHEVSGTVATFSIVPGA